MNLEKIINSLPDKVKTKLNKKKQPNWIYPELATLTDKYFSSKDWLYEHKFDGERILAFKNGKTVKLFTRNQKDASSDYPEIVKMLEKQNLDDFIIDGEVIALQDGDESFSLLQTVMHSSGKHTHITIVYAIFDIMHIGPYDLTGIDLLYRKKILSQALKFQKPLSYTQHILKDGLEYYAKACKLGWEGVIAKNINSTYIQDRTRDWLKFKCIKKQEFVIGGYTDPKNGRINFGALLVGYYDGDKLMYAGKVGTGYTEEILQNLGQELKKLKQAKSPFYNIDINLSDVHWVKPKLVCEVKFAEWTARSHLRHSRFAGLRRDKSAKDVIKEMPS